MSGFLSDESFEKADNMLKAAFPVDDDGDGFIGEPIETRDEEPDDDIDETSDALDDDVNLSGEESEECEEEYVEGHKIPYRRFKNVLDARNEYKGEIESLRERNRALEAYLATKPSSPDSR